MRFVWVYVAWLCFGVGVINLIGEYTAFLDRIYEGKTGFSVWRVFKALFITLCFSIWYYLLLFK